MSLSRFIFVVASVFLLEACGFRPLYGLKGSDFSAVEREFALIEISQMRDWVGQQLHNRLEHLLHPHGQADKPRYRLSAELAETRISLSVSKTALATRANLIISTNFNLASLVYGKKIFSSSSSSSVSYNILDSEFGTLIAEKDARARAIREIAEEIKLRLGAYFGGRQGESS